MNEEDGMMALCIEKNTFLHVAVLPHGNSTEQTPGLRRCRSDSGNLGMPQELSELSGIVVTWPEFGITPQGITPASDQEAFREPSDASPTADTGAITSKTDWDTADCASEASTVEWESQQGGCSRNSPVSVPGRVTLGSAVAEWASEASCVEWQNQQGGKSPSSPASVVGRGSRGTAVAEWSSEASTVEWQSQQGGRNRNLPVSVVERGSQLAAVVQLPGEGSTVERQSQFGVGCSNSSLLQDVVPGSQASSVEWASFRQSHASSIGFGGVGFRMHPPPATSHGQNTHFVSASVGISNLQSGSSAMPNSIQGNGFVRDENRGVSLGSLGHGRGSCAPCAHAWRSAGCSKGDQCSRCHLCDESAFRQYRQEHRKFSRALRRATRRGQVIAGGVAVAIQNSVIASSSSSGARWPPAAGGMAVATQGGVSASSSSSGAR